MGALVFECVCVCVGEHRCMCVLLFASECSLLEESLIYTLFLYENSYIYLYTYIGDRQIKIRVDIFDDIENVIFTYIVDTYFNSFKLSPIWAKLFQFLYMTERKVVEDDFSLFRGMYLWIYMYVCVFMLH